METAWIIGGCIFGAGILALLIYGIATDKKRKAELEKGFLADLIPTKGWVPLTLIVDQELVDLEDVLLSVVKEAATWWSEQVGEKFFYPPGELAVGGHIVPIQAAPLDTTHDPDHAFAYVQPWVNKSTKELAGMSINMMPGWESASHSTLVEALRHEMGHCLGLAHDDYPESIMYGKLDQRAGIVSDHDKELLRKTYVG